MYIPYFTRHRTLHCSIWSSWPSRKLILNTFLNSSFGLVFDFTILILLSRTEIRFVKTDESEPDWRETSNVISWKSVYQNWIPFKYLKSLQPWHSTNTFEIFLRAPKPKTGKNQPNPKFAGYIEILNPFKLTGSSRPVF